MSQKASEERLQNSRVPVTCWWFHGRDLKGLFEQVEQQGAENVRLVVTPGLDEKGRPDLHLKVVPEGDDMFAKDHHEFNESHPCPPDCG